MSENDSEIPKIPGRNGHGFGHFGRSKTENRDAALSKRFAALLALDSVDFSSSAERRWARWARQDWRNNENVYRNSMKFYEFLWVSMNFYECLWNSMTFYEFQTSNSLNGDFKRLIYSLETCSLKYRRFKHWRSSPASTGCHIVGNGPSFIRHRPD